MTMFSRRRRPELAVVREEPSDFATSALAQVDGLYSLALHMTGSRSDAEDLVQETYARAFAGRFDEGSNLRAWLFRILRNCFIDQARRRKIVLEIPDDTIDALAVDTSLEQLRYLTRGELERAIAALPPEYRFVILLDVEGFSEAETADVLRCPAGTVKSRLSRAKARLRAMLQEAR